MCSSVSDIKPNPMTATDIKPPHTPCQCPLCVRAHEFAKRISPLPEEDRKWLNGLYDHLVDTEEELSMRQAEDAEKKEGKL